MPRWSDRIRERLAGRGLNPATENEIVEELAQHWKRGIAINWLVALQTSTPSGRPGANWTPTMRSRR